MIIYLLLRLITQEIKMRRQVVGCRMLFASLRWIIGCATIRPTSPADRPIYILVYMLHSIFCRDFHVLVK
jgi:hypothetical protein